MRPPRQEARDLRVAGVAVEDRLSVVRAYWAQGKPCRCERFREHHVALTKLVLALLSVEENASASAPVWSMRIGSFELTTLDAPLSSK